MPCFPVRNLQQIFYAVAIRVGYKVKYLVSLRAKCSLTVPGFVNFVRNYGFSQTFNRSFD